jgi:hypothetical protein
MEGELLPRSAMASHGIVPSVLTCIRSQHEE